MFEVVDDVENLLWWCVVDLVLVLVWILEEEVEVCSVCDVVIVRGLLKDLNLEQRSGIFPRFIYPPLPPPTAPPVQTRLRRNDAISGNNEEEASKSEIKNSQSGTCIRWRLYMRRMWWKCKTTQIEYPLAKPNFLLLAAETDCYPMYNTSLITQSRFLIPSQLIYTHFSPIHQTIASALSIRIC